MSRRYWGIIFSSVIIFPLLLLQLPLAQAKEHVFTSFDIRDLEWTKHQVLAGDREVKPAFDELLRIAQRDLKSRPRSVLDKEGIANSGDKHDFFSMSQYAWRDDARPDGSVYAYRDGSINPEARSVEYDKRNFSETILRINRLSLAYYLSRDSRYAEKAATLIKVWFLDPRTRMNPNFRYAGTRPGLDNGRSTGIMESVSLIEMLDYVALLDDSGALSSSDHEQITAWFCALSGWLRSSDFGMKQANAINNQGAWYQALVIAFSIYCGEDDVARAALPRVEELLSLQFDTQGSMPAEMERANSAMYSIYALRSFIVLARLFESFGVRLWDEEAAGSPILKNALSFLAPYYSGSQVWKDRSSLSKIDTYAIQVFRLGARAYNTEDYNDAMASIIAQKPQTDRHTHLLGPTVFEPE